MIRSMTGFGRAEGVVKEKKIAVEFRALNSRQLDLSLRLPSLYREREADLRQWVGERVARGKVDVSVTAESAQAEKRTSFDAALVAAYHAELKALVARIDPASPTDLLGLVLRLPDVARTEREDLDEQEWTAVMDLAGASFAAFDAFRSAEGARLFEDLAARTRMIAQLLDEVAAMDRDRADRTRERLKSRLADLKVQIDQDRFEQELVYYLEKLDINEEKVRLQAHCTYFLETLEKEELQGRKLGFITQEMGREINTIGSKANDATMQRLVVRMKDELEKVKEQTMNVL